MARPTVLDHPFEGGVVRDAPPFELERNQCSSAKDMVLLNHLATQRRGWIRDGGMLNANDLVAAARARYALVGETRTVAMRKVVGGQYELILKTGAGLGDVLQTWYVDAGNDANHEFLPRGFYGDYQWWMHSSGHESALLYRGADDAPVTTSTNFGPSGGIAINESRTDVIEWLGGGEPPKPGNLLWVTRTLIRAPQVCLPVVDREGSGNTDEAVFENLVASANTGLSSGPPNYVVGITYPTCGVYNAGTVDSTGGTQRVTGYGTKWVNGDWGKVTGRDALLYRDAQNDWYLTAISAAMSDTEIDRFNTALIDKVDYEILRPVPCKDMMVLNGALIVGPTAQHQNRVWTFPPGWNPMYPPGLAFGELYDPANEYPTKDTTFHTGRWFDVPDRYDSDGIVALLEAPGVGLVLKGQSVHGIYGYWGQYEQRPLRDGFDKGCIDIRSAQNLPMGPVWAGKLGIFTYQNGRIIDLTRINGDPGLHQDWLDLMTEFQGFANGDLVTIGEADNNLFVSYRTAGDTKRGTWLFNIERGVWSSNEVTNHNARYYFSDIVEGEAPDTIWVTEEDTGYLHRSRTVVDGTGGPRDADGHSPELDVRAPTNVAEAGGVEGSARLLEVSVAAQQEDTVDEASAIEVSVRSIDSILNDSDESVETTLAADILSSTSPEVFRHERDINEQGRQHELRVRQKTTSPTHVKTGIAQVTFRWRDSRRGS